MRGLLISFVLLAALAAAPVQGHEGEAHHAIPFTAVLGPAATLDVPLTFEEGPLEASWVFLLVAEVESNGTAGDRKSTRLNSSHGYLSYTFSFFLKEPATTEISPLPLPDALPIS